MFIALADENAGPEHAHLERCDVIRIARERVLENPDLCDPEKCKEVSSQTPGDRLASRDKQARTQHEHGSAACITAYLGPVNWPLTTAKRAIHVPSYRPGPATHEAHG